MLHHAPYKIRTVEEAKGEGYVPMGLHAPTLKPCLGFIEVIREKARWLRLLTPERIVLLGPYLDPYVSVLRYSFIIVDQESDGEDEEEHADNHYGMWRRDITRDN
ncbi:MAG: hypothetical protein Q8Q94_03270 [bacterium]|nr:hypothetical protein [bacterium]MDZ4299971.1 hypothetical protein [Candidatus Sungbacteria bacterium]